jgi:hypothetical protein
MANAAAVDKKTEPAAPHVKWNVEHLKSSYVNFANANSTREEVVMKLGPRPA